MKTEETDGLTGIPSGPRPPVSDDGWRTFQGKGHREAKGNHENRDPDYYVIASAQKEVGQDRRVSGLTEGISDGKNQYLCEL